MPIAPRALARRVLTSPPPFLTSGDPRALARYDAACFTVARARRRLRRQARAGYRRVREEPRLLPLFTRLIAIRDRVR